MSFPPLTGDIFVLFVGVVGVQAKHEFRWEAPANPGQGTTQGATRSRLSTTRVYDASWFNRQNKAELSARSHRTRPIGLYWEERRDPETGKRSWQRNRRGIGRAA